jgi:hypothetical protein
MLAKVSIAEFIDLALCCPAKKAMLAIGEFGIGKTQVIRQIGKQLGLRVVNFDCTNLDNAGDILGIPTVKDGRTDFNPTYWYSKDEPVLLFFDEVFRANNEVRAALMTLCLEQTIADKKLAPGSRVFAAANPPGFHGYEGEIPDPAQLSRYAAYWLDPTFNEWMAHAKAAKIHPSIIDYLSKNKSDLDPFSNAKAMDVGPSDGSELVILPSRRSWFDFSENLYNAEKIKNVKKLDNAFVINMGSGYVGPTIAVKYAPFYQNASSAVGAEDILRDWKSIKPKNDDDLFDVATATKLTNDIKIFVTAYKKDTKKDVPEKWKKNFSSFIREGMSKEAQVAIINNLVYQDMMAQEDWVYDISDEALQTFYETTIAAKVA